MPATPIYALRYPAPTDPADGPLGFQHLAEDVEGKLGGAPVSALPGSPVDSQVIRYKVGANGPVWTLQYVAASAAPYRWHVVGGAPLYAARSTRGEFTSSVTYVDLTTPGPSVTAPLAGEYLAQFGGMVKHDNLGGYGFVSVKIGTAATADGDGFLYQAQTAGGQLFTYAAKTITVPTAASALKLQYRSGGGIFSVDPPGPTALFTSILVTPLRVG